MYHAIQSSVLTENLAGVCSAAGDLVLETNPRKGGGVLTLDLVSTHTPTANAVVAIEFLIDGAVHGVETVKMVNASYWYKTRGPARVPSDSRVRLTFSDAGASKACKASIYGYVEYMREE